MSFAYACLPLALLPALAALAFGGCGSSQGAPDGGPTCDGGCFDALAERAPLDVRAKDVVEEPEAAATCTSTCKKLEALKGCPDPGCAGDCARQETLCTGPVGLALFQALLDCEMGASYSCSKTSPPLPVTSDCDAAAVAAASACSADAGSAEAGCTMTGGVAACTACCASLNTAGADTYGIALKHCACSSPGVCLTPCVNTECASVIPPTGSACAKCLQDSLGPDGGCELAVAEACGSDPKCMAYEACLASSNCSKK